MSETPISKALRKAIKRLFPQIRCTRLQTGIIQKKNGGRVHCADEGWPDVIGYLPCGRAFAVEVKTLDGELSDEQEKRIADMRECGCVAIVCYGAYDGLKQIKEILK